MLRETKVQHKLEASKLRTPSTAHEGFYSFKNVVVALLLVVAYLLVSRVLIGFKAEQLVLSGLFLVGFFASRQSRNFTLGFSVFIIYWIVFDYMKAFPNYQFKEVHIKSLYEAEKAWFGWNINGTVLTPNEFFARHSTNFLDVISGLLYLCWIPVPLAFAAILFFKNRQFFFQFALSFFLVNIIGFIGYYVYPAAPPWYVVKYGFDFIASTPGDAAGLARFDEITGIPVFNGIYSKSSNVFAAMPSLHAAYMMIVLYFSIRMKLKYWNVLFAMILGGIWFAAVYSGHHYILDVIGGMISAVLGIFLFQWFAHSRPGSKLLQLLVDSTSVKR